MKFEEKNNVVDKLFIFAFFCQNAKIYIHRWIYVMWTYLRREFFDHIWAVYRCVELYM